MSKGAYISTVADSNAPGGVRYVTNSEAYTLTNTIGFFPNAVNLYPYSIRLAFVGPGGWDGNLEYIPEDLQPPYACPEFETTDYIGETPGPRPYKGPHIGWIVPDDDYMTSGDISWFGSHASSYVFPSPAMYYAGANPFGDDIRPWFDTYFQRQKHIWTNYVTLATANYITTTSYQYEASVQTNTTPWRTNLLNVTTNYQGTYSVNTYYDFHQGLYDQYAIYVLPSMMFPFERDGAFVRMNDPLWSSYAEIDALQPPVNQFWSTNAYRDMGRAVSLMQWIKDMRDFETQIVVTVTWTNSADGVSWVGGIYESTTVSTNTESSLFSKYLKRWRDGSGGHVVQASYVPYRGFPYRKARLTVSTTLRRFKYTNGGPFTNDTVHIWPEGSVTNGSIPAAWTSRIDLCSTLLPNATIIRTNLWPDEIAAVESWSRGIGDGWQTNDIAGLPQYAIGFEAGHARGVYPEPGLFVASMSNSPP